MYVVVSIVGVAKCDGLDRLWHSFRAVEVCDTVGKDSDSLELSPFPLTAIGPTMENYSNDSVAFVKLCAKGQGARWKARLNLSRLALRTKPVRSHRNKNGRVQNPPMFE